MWKKRWPMSLILQKKASSWLSWRCSSSSGNSWWVRVYENYTCINKFIYMCIYICVLTSSNEEFVLCFKKYKRGRLSGFDLIFSEFSHQNLSLESDIKICHLSRDVWYGKSAVATFTRYMCYFLFNIVIICFVIDRIVGIYTNTYYVYTSITYRIIFLVN